MNKRGPSTGLKWKIYTDGAIRPDKGISGLAAIVRDEKNRIRFWWFRRAGLLTCNEAEFAAAIFALERLFHRCPNPENTEVELFSDSKVLVDQMTNRAVAHAPELQKAQLRLQSLIQSFNKVSFHHIFREHNRLADALAYEAVMGKPEESKPRQHQPKPKLWEELANIWRKV